MQPEIQSINQELDRVVTNFKEKAVKRATTASNKKRKRPKSFKKKKQFTFLDTYITDQYNDYKRRETQNHLIKMKLYKEIGMPPLPKTEKVNAETLETEQSKTKDTSQPIKIEK